MRISFPIERRWRRALAPVALACVVAACAPAPQGQPILAASRASGMLAVSAEGANNVRILYARGESIVLLRTVFMPAGERVRAVAWSDDDRGAVITTSSGVLALDTRTWRLASVTHVAAAAADDGTVDRRR
jgi:hypothetical protein